LIAIGAKIVPLNLKKRAKKKKRGDNKFQRSDLTPIGSAEKKNRIHLTDKIFFKKKNLREDEKVKELRILQPPRCVSL
jgi:hypothetical protein